MAKIISLVASIDTPVYALHLSEREAQYLRNILGHISGEPLFAGEIRTAFESKNLFYKQGDFYGSLNYKGPDL